jgi:FtsH-binding integral membrane protein
MSSATEIIYAVPQRQRILAALFSTNTSIINNNNNNTKMPRTNRQRQKHKRNVLLCAVVLGALALALFPLRAVASTVVESTVGAAAAAAAAAVPALATVAAPALVARTITAASPIPAALEMQLTIRLIYAAFMGACLGKERSSAKHSGKEVVLGPMLFEWRVWSGRRKIHP